MLRRGLLKVAAAGLASGAALPMPARAAAPASHPSWARSRDAPPPAEEDALDLLLVLAVDVSRSVDEGEALLQREGYRAAVADPAVIAAIRGGAAGAVGLAYVEWAGAEYQRLVVPWTRIASQADAVAFSERLAVPPRAEEALIRSDLHTSISGGIEFSRWALSEAPWGAARRVIDVSGDGDNNSGPAAEEARDRAAAEGITINGLPILNDRPPFAYFGPAPLDEYYRDAVIGGPGAFVVAAEGFGDFARAIRRKLVREIAVRPASAAPA